jgi:hypothetical protein
LISAKRVPAGNQTYPKLHALLEIDDLDLNLSALQRRIHLRHNLEEEFQCMVASIKECRKKLEKDADQKRKYGHSINQGLILNKIV